MTPLKNYSTVNNKKASGSDTQWELTTVNCPPNDNNLIIVRRAPGYFLFLWYCVLLIRRDDHDNQSDSSPVTPILRERRPGPGLAARRGAGDLQETRTLGQPAPLPDLPSLQGRGVSMGGGASQIPPLIM